MKREEGVGIRGGVCSRRGKISQDNRDSIREERMLVCCRDYTMFHNL